MEGRQEVSGGVVFATAQWLTDPNAVLVAIRAAIDKQIEESQRSTGCVVLSLNVELAGPMASDEVGKQ